jgi:hypothetical protein
VSRLVAFTCGVFLAVSAQAQAAPVADFAADVSPSLTTATAGPAPEPAAWTLMILGIGGLGVGLRRQRQKSPATDAKVRPHSH